MSQGSSIIVCEQHFDVGRKVVTFADDPAFSAYTLHRTDQPSEIYPFAPAKGLGLSAARYRTRYLIGSERSLGRLQQVLRQFVIHHDGCPSSRACFHVLHNERGLSVHFLIDNDGTIFQTLDLVDCAFQAAGVNEISVGVELANRGDALRYPDEYRGQRDKLTCRIHGHQFLAYGYTKDQLDSMAALGRTMARLFPNLPATFPVGSDGEPMWSALSDPRQYAGYLGHYHVTDHKWDPGPFDFQQFVGGLRGRTFFPLGVGDLRELPELKDGDEQAQEQAVPYYDNNESDGEGGYYPVGPLGQSRLWHGGVHLRADRGTPIYAPFAGKIVAARMAEPCAIGSRNFVLLRHDLHVKGPVTFFTLLFHLDEEPPGPQTPRWLHQAARLFGDDPVALSIEVSAGELIGHAGEAGAPGRMEGQVHVEIMSTDELGQRIEPGFWRVVDGSAGGRFCTAPEIIELIDRPVGGKRDGLLSRAELLSFFRSDPRREELHKMAVRHLSEWGDENDWLVALGRARDFAAIPKSQRVRLFKEQIEPVLWWTNEIGEAAGLPSDRMVWSYHPIRFVVWLHEQIRGGTQASSGITDAGAFQGKAPPKELKDDGDATEGFTDDEDRFSGEAAKKLDLEDLVNGYPDQE